MARRGENIRRRADGRWEARAIVGYHANGKPVYKSVYARSYSEVKEKQRQLPRLREAKEIPASLKKATFGQLMDDWLLYTQKHVKESTYAKYCQLNRVHISPCLGTRYLISLTSDDLEIYMSEKLRCGKKNGKGGLAPKTVMDILALIRQALRFGADRNYPCPPNLEIHYPRQTVPQIQILSAEEQRTLEKELFQNKTPVCLGILLSLYTGLRIGEVCALRWEDFQLEKSIVRVQKTLMRIQAVGSASGDGERQRTKLLVDSPKSIHSIRTIPLPSFLNAHLKSFQKPDGCYLLTGNESCMEPRNYYRKYRRLMESWGLSSFNYHALRHTFATRCVEKGFDVKTLSEILGHADVSITMRRYVHPTLDMKKEQMERLGCLFIQGQINGQKESGNAEYIG